MRLTRTWTLARGGAILREVAIGVAILLGSAAIGVLIAFVVELLRGALSG